jgi:Mg-chelatase subunit ChlD
MAGKRIAGARDAAKAAVAELDPTDDVVMIVFDTDATVFVRRQRAGAVDERDIDRLRAGGGTDYLPAFELAGKELSKLKGKKHIILLTDFGPPSDGLAKLLDEMRVEDITTSAIGLHGASRNLLQMIVENGDGKLYLIDDPAALSKVFASDVAEFLPR